MPHAIVGSKTDAPVERHNDDHASGQPSVLIHDNPEGVDAKIFDDVKAAVANDRYAFFEDFLNNFYNVDVLGGTRISDRAWQASFNVAAGSSPFASYACVDTWLTDFRADLPKIDVPVLVMHGTEDRILPFDSTAARLPALIA